MPVVNLPLAKYRDSQSDRIDPGRYTVRVEDADVQESKAGKTMVVTWLKVVDGEFEGATLVDRMTLTEAAMFRIVGFMKAVKLPVPKRDININTDVFIGRLLDVDVADQEYRDRVNSQVTGYMMSTHTSSKAEEPDLDDLENLAGVGGQEPPETEEPDEEISDEPTDYDEDVEPEKAKAAQRKKDEKRTAEQAAKPSPTGEPEVVDLDDIPF